MKWDGSSWASVGIPGFSAGAISSPSLADDDGTLYLAYTDEANGYKATVMKWDGGNWASVGTSGFSADSAFNTSLALNNGTPYVAYSDRVYGSRATVMKWDGNNWVPVGTPGFSAGAAAFPTLAISNGTPYVAYSDGGNGSKATVMMNITTGTVTGTVNGSGNTPVSGATVSIGEITAATDSQGAFTLLNVPAGDQTVSVTAAGYNPGSAAVSVTAGSSVNAGTVILSQMVTTGTITGTVKGSGNTPVSGATVSIGAITAATDSQGAFTLLNVPAGDQTVSVTAAGYNPGSAAVSVTAGSSVNAGTVTLSQMVTTGTITGTVKGSGNTPVSGATVSIGAITATTDNQGAFTLLNVPAGNQTVSVTAAGYNPGSTAVSVTAGSSVNAGTMTLSQMVTTGTITGTVKGPGNTPVSGATVSIGAITATTDSQGVYTLLNVPAGDQTVSVTAAGYNPGSTAVSVTVGSSVNAGTVTLSVPSSRGGSSSSSSPSLISGQLAVNSSLSISSTSSNPSAITQVLGSDVSLQATVLGADRTSLSNIVIGSNGQFQLNNSIATGTYPVILDVTAPDGEVLAGKAATLTVNADRSASILADLIDPSGIILNSVTKQPVSGVNVKLYWADTELNRSKGRTPGALVKLPKLPELAPNQNHNPQVSVADGRYGWMVFPDGDYYVIADKEGYKTYDSRQDNRDEQQGETSFIRNGTIHVGKTIVQLNFSMDPNFKTAQSGYIHGYPNGTFQPNKSITRAELASILSQLAQNKSEQEKTLYSDVANNDWASSAIETVNANQWMVGYPDGTFKPNAPVTRAEMAAVLVKLENLQVHPTPATFSDVEGSWAKDLITSMKEQGWLSGYPDGTFRPDHPITRAETVVLMNRVFGLKSNTVSASTPWSDVSPSYWGYADILEATASH